MAGQRPSVQIQTVKKPRFDNPSNVTMMSFSSISSIFFFRLWPNFGEKQSTDNERPPHLGSSSPEQITEPDRLDRHDRPSDALASMQRQLIAMHMDRSRRHRWVRPWVELLMADVPDIININLFDYLKLIYLRLPRPCLTVHPLCSHLCYFPADSLNLLHFLTFLHCPIQVLFLSHVSLLILTFILLLNMITREQSSRLCFY